MMEYFYGAQSAQFASVEIPKELLEEQPLSSSDHGWGGDSGYGDDDDDAGWGGGSRGYRGGSRGGGWGGGSRGGYGGRPAKPKYKTSWRR